jgi:hypothetical protein
MKRRDNLRRRRPLRQPHPRILIVCEGTRTEPRYFREMRHRERIPVDLEIDPGGTPKTLVERAVASKKTAERQAKSGKDRNSLYDEVWCVFDVDEHPFLAEARQQATDNHLSLAISNPCFELWVLLHFEDQRAHIERGQVQHQCREHLPRFEKEVPGETLAPLYVDAMRRARELDAWHESRGTAGENPSTGVYKLTERIKAIAERRIRFDPEREEILPL